MDYIKVGFSFLLIEEYQKDLLIADLAEVGFETFEDTQKGFDAFVQKRLFDLNQDVYKRQGGRHPKFVFD